MLGRKRPSTVVMCLRNPSCQLADLLLTLSVLPKKESQTKPNFTGDATPTAADVHKMCVCILAAQYSFKLNILASLTTLQLF